MEEALTCDQHIALATPIERLMPVYQSRMVAPHPRTRSAKGNRYISWPKIYDFSEFRLCRT
jgi:hypothetical protein